MHVVVYLLSHSGLFVIPWTIAHQAPLSMGCPRQEHWNGLPSPSPGDLWTHGLNPCLLHCRQLLYRLSHREAPLMLEGTLKIVSFSEDFTHAITQIWN